LMVKITVNITENQYNQKNQYTVHTTNKLKNQITLRASDVH